MNLNEKLRIEFLYRKNKVKSFLKRTVLFNLRQIKISSSVLALTVISLFSYFVYFLFSLEWYKLVDTIESEITKQQIKLEETEKEIRETIWNEYFVELSDFKWTWIDFEYDKKEMTKSWIILFKEKAYSKFPSLKSFCKEENIDLFWQSDVRNWIKPIVWLKFNEAENKCFVKVVREYYYSSTDYKYIEIENKEKYLDDDFFRLRIKFTCSSTF